MENQTVKFGVAGNSQSFFDEGGKTTLDAARWCAARGIDVFEYSFGRGVTLPEATAKKIGAEFSASGVEMTVHAPYFINFANPDPDMIEKSIGYVLQSVKKADDFGASRVVVHPASVGKVTREDAVNATFNNLKTLAEVLDDRGLDRVKICLETMGKVGQIGTVDEIVSFCALSPVFYPCIDFGHVNAREQGSLKTSADFDAIIQKMSDFLPEEKVIGTHVHFSKIKYGAKGELCHLTFADTEYGPQFEPFAEVLVKRRLLPYIICESDGTQAEDALAMKAMYNEALLNK